MGFKDKVFTRAGASTITLLAGSNVAVEDIYQAQEDEVIIEASLWVQSADPILAAAGHVHFEAYLTPRGRYHEDGELAHAEYMEVFGAKTDVMYAREVPLPPLPPGKGISLRDGETLNLVYDWNNTSATVNSRVTIGWRFSVCKGTVN